MWPVILTVLGLIAGSFINALVWRIRERELKPKAKGLSILSDRSICPNCHHKLAAKDLIPVLSWLSLRGRCRYCSKPISWQYPLVEIATAGAFLVSYYYWPDGVYGVGAWLLLTTWLVVSVGLIALFIYDLKWQILPNQIIYPTLAVAVAGRLIYLVSFAPNFWHGVLQWALSIAVASGIFLAIYLLSKGQWIGYGDVRLGLITGTVLGRPSLSLLMIFLASMIGTIFALPLLASGKKHLTDRLAYGPFLILGTALALIFGDSLFSAYDKLLLK